MNAHPSPESRLEQQPDKGAGSRIVALTPLKAAIQATVMVPGSKSYTIRALILAALACKPAGHPVRVWNPLRSDDGLAVMGCLNALGIETRWGHEGGQSYVDVYGEATCIAEGDYTLHANLSAATLRFLIAVSAVIPGRQTLLGHEGLNRRPVKDLVDALRTLGVEIEYLEQEGYPPVRVSSSGISATRLTVSGSTSSQYISALMMIAPLIQSQGAPIEIALPDAPVSKPYLDMTMAILRAFGVETTHQDYQTFQIPAGQVYKTESYTVEPDASSAAYFAAIATLTGSSITLKNMNADSVQADLRFIEMLKQMGTQVHFNNGDLIVEGHGVKPIQVNMCDCPDQAQALAVLAAFANGVTRIEGLQSLRVKETDRITAVETELRKMGIQVESEMDALVIHGGQPKPACIATYGDHRMAMAFAVAGSLLEGLTLADPAVVNKTYPEFWQDLAALGVGVEERQPAAETVDEPNLPGAATKLVLIGFMGSGKSTVAQLLAEQYQLSCVEMDDRIVQQSGKTKVADIFDHDGEAAFRLLEAQLAESLRLETNVVISTGGGVIMDGEVMKNLSEQATVIWLNTRFETVLERLKHRQDRPLLRDLEKAEALYAQRLPLYQQAAHLTIDTDGLSSQAVVAQINQALGAIGENCRESCTV
ncbi:3-phosphoshikimate 1-carboxyvinyltransferase [Vampirovibrio sp.]|uniref:3-phosphoshikimate 1-carboxyvinyltransferase n=1 Tax=Vampirovibrio sp. TaxID=2717857 RepID=UPI0035946B0A